MRVLTSDRARAVVLLALILALMSSCDSDSSTGAGNADGRAIETESYPLLTAVGGQPAAYLHPDFKRRAVALAAASGGRALVPANGFFPDPNPAGLSSVTTTGDIAISWSHRGDASDGQSATKSVEFQSVVAGQKTQAEQLWRRRNESCRRRGRLAERRGYELCVLSEVGRTVITWRIGRAQLLGLVAEGGVSEAQAIEFAGTPLVDLAGLRQP